MLKIENIELKPISSSDTDFIIKMRNNLQIADNFFSDPPVYDFEHINWLNTKAKDNLEFIIVFNGQKAGKISLTDINFRHQKAEYGIMILNEFQNKKIAEKASKLLIDYVFLNIPIRKIVLHVFSNNDRAISLYKSLGFRKEGEFKEEFYKNGKYLDLFRMALFKNDWLK